MNLTKVYGDAWIAEGKVWKKRVSFLKNLPVSVEDSDIKLSAKIGGLNYHNVHVRPRRGVANYIGFGGLELKGYEIVIPADKSQIQAAIIGPEETYFFHTNSRAMEKYGMEQKEYFESCIGN